MGDNPYRSEHTPEANSPSDADVGAGEEISVELTRDGRGLSIGCSPAAFSRLRQEVCRSAEFAETCSDVVHIHIHVKRPVREPVRYWLREKIFLFGCGLVVMAIGCVFYAGIVQIAAWFRG